MRAMVHAARHCALAVVLMSGMGCALAGSGRQMPGTVLPAYSQECGSCHTAYPPGLLPARSWQRLMSRLNEHYGTDASPDMAATTQVIAAWLQVNAGTYKRVREEPPQDRITRSAWFERKHRKVDDATWRLASVKSPANCSACHADADRGHFDDDDLLLPPGLTAGQRRTWKD